MSNNSRYISTHGLQVDADFYAFINQNVIAGLNIDQAKFWQGAAALIEALAPENKALLAQRKKLQNQIDAFYEENGGDVSIQESEAFLRDIGYLTEEGEDFTISTSHVDEEIATIAGPQLVVPISNARYVLNAMNARWGSLYDALYGTDVISEEDGAEKGKAFNPIRAEKVIDWAKRFLDEIAPLQHTSWIDITGFEIQNGALILYQESQDNKAHDSLKEAALFKGYKGNPDSPTSVLLQHNDLHLEIMIDANTPAGAIDKASISDIILESAVSTIVDLEDSVAVVDAEDKIQAYGNWLGLMRGELQERVEKGKRSFIRTLNQDRDYISPQGDGFSLHGRSLVFVRNVGHLMTNPTILLADGSEIPEGIMDAIFTSLIALYDLRKNGGQGETVRKN